jgi:hypothetical protein
LKPSEILKTMKKNQWTTGTYWTTPKCKGEINRYCFSGFIFYKTLGYAEPKYGDINMSEVFGRDGRLIHDYIIDINDDCQQLTFTQKKNRAIAFLKREGL